VGLIGCHGEKKYLQQLSSDTAADGITRKGMKRLIHRHPTHPDQRPMSCQKYFIQKQLYFRLPKSDTAADSVIGTAMKRHNYILAGPFGGCVQKEKARGKFKELKEKQSNSKRVNVHLIFCRPVISHHVDIVHKVLLSLSYSA
jgi:hypothetical protein